MKTFRIEQKRIRPSINGNTREARAVVEENGKTIERLSAYWGTSANEVFDLAEREAREWIRKNP